MKIEEIKRLVREGSYEFSAHAQQERLDEDLDVEDVEGAVAAGEILEDYPDDPRGESCLMVGFVESKPIHVVLGWARRTRRERVLRLITVYLPKPPKWIDPHTRGERQ